MPNDPGGTDDFKPSEYLTSLIATINDEAKSAQGSAILFLLVGLYLLATAVGVSDEDLLLGRTVTIAQIGATVPVVFSFAIAPMVFVFLHIYALVRYDMLAGNLRQFRKEVRESVPLESHRERCRQLLVNTEFVDALTASHGSALYSPLSPWLFRAIVAWFPVVVVLFVQINALRYQSDRITLIQLGSLALDLAALVWFFARNPLDVGTPRRVRHWRRTARLGVLVSLSALLASLDYYWLATVPADADPNFVRYDPASLYWRDHPHTQPSLADKARQPLDLLLCAQLNWGCRFLRIDHRTLVGKVWDEKAVAELRAGTSNPGKALAAIEGVELRRRSLRFAVFEESRLYAADLIGADLTGARLAGANISGARLARASLRGTDVTQEQLSSASRDLYGVDLRGADLRNAQLQGADLRDAHMQGADLSGAQLQAADLTFAQLQGAALAFAQLQGAVLYGAQLQGADLSGAKLWRAYASNYRPANLSLADLRHADFDTRVTKPVLDGLLQTLAAVPDRREAEARLRASLAPDSGEDQLSFTAGPSRPVLADPMPIPALAGDGHLLIDEPTRSYQGALVAYLAGELAPSDPAIAAGIVRRTIPGLYEVQTDSISLKLACRLLADGKIDRARLDELDEALANSGQNCTIAPPVAIPTR